MFCGIDAEHHLHQLTPGRGYGETAGEEEGWAQFGPVCNFSLPHSNLRNDVKLLTGLCEIMHQSHKASDG